MQNLSTVRDEWVVAPTTPENKTITTDDLIDAFIKGTLKGRQDQIDREEQQKQNTLESNVEKTTKIVGDLYREIASQGFQCSDIRLKMLDIYRHSLIFLIDEKDYLNDKFLKIYEKSIKLKQKNNSDIFDLSITFTSNNKYLNLNNVIADGYILSYDLQKN